MLNHVNSKETFLFEKSTFRREDGVNDDVVFYGPSTQVRSVLARSITDDTLFLGRPRLLAVNQYYVHILSSVAGKCPSRISGRERMAVEIIS